MSLPLPADHPAPDPVARLARPADGRPFGQRIRVPKTAELVAAEPRRKIVRGELAEAENYLLMNKSMTTVLDLLG